MAPYNFCNKETFEAYQLYFSNFYHDEYGKMLDDKKQLTQESLKAYFLTRINPKRRRLSMKKRTLLDATRFNIIADQLNGEREEYELYASWK